MEIPPPRRPSATRRHSFANDSVTLGGVHYQREREEDDDLTSVHKSVRSYGEAGPTIELGRNKETRSEPHSFKYYVLRFQYVRCDARHALVPNFLFLP